MKQSVRCLLLLGLSLILGILGAFLRSFYFKNALDAGGYLLSRRPEQILYWVLAAVLILTALILGRKPSERQEIIERNRKIIRARSLTRAQRRALQKAAAEDPSAIRRLKMNDGWLPGTARILLGISLLLTAFFMDQALMFYGALRILGLAAAALLIVDGILRFLHKQLGILSGSVFCIFMLLYVVSSYAQWRGTPEMERFLVPAAVCLTLLPLSCEMTAWDCGSQLPSLTLILSTLTVFFGISAMGGPGAEPLHLGAAAWSLIGIWILRKEGEQP